DGVPDRQALDQRRGFREFEHHFVDVVFAAGLIAVALARAQPVKIPDILQAVKVLLSRDAADGGNDTGKRASGVGASRKAEDIDFVALHPIERQEREPALHVAAHAHAKDAAQKAVEGSTAADAGVVVDNLASIFFICGLNGLADPDDVG